MQAEKGVQGGASSCYFKSFKCPLVENLIVWLESRIWEDTCKKLPKYCPWATYIPLDCLQNELMMNPSGIVKVTPSRVPYTILSQKNFCKDTFKG